MLLALVAALVVLVEVAVVLLVAAALEAVVDDIVFVVVEGEKKLGFWIGKLGFCIGKFCWSKALVKVWRKKFGSWRGTKFGLKVRSSVGSSCCSGCRCCGCPRPPGR